MAIDWVMKVSTKDKRNGIQWTLWTQLDDLDFADDIALLSHNHQQMQEKTSLVAQNSEKLGLKIHNEKSKLLKVNSTSTHPISIETKTLEEVDSFTYLGSIVDKQGGTDADIKIRIRKARIAFQQLKNIWTSRNLSYKTKIRIFNTNVKSVLLYGAETWRTTINTNKKLQTFINSCLRRILKIRWPETIRNEELWKRTRSLYMLNSNSAAGDGLATPFVNHPLIPLGRHLSGTLKKRDNEEGRQTPGAESLNLMS